MSASRSGKAPARPRKTAARPKKAIASAAGDDAESSSSSALLLDRAGSGKSGAFKWFLEKLKSADGGTVWEGAPPDGARAARIAFADMAQALKGANGERNTPTLRAFLNGMSNEARHAFGAHARMPTNDAMKTVVYCFDNYARVALCKDVEHAERTRKGGSGGGVPPGFALGGLDDPLDDGFQAALHDRYVWTPRLIAWLCKQWCADCPFLRKAGDRLIVSGHCLTYGDLPETAARAAVAVHPDAPLVLERAEDGALKVDFLDDLAHRHGEADLAMLYLMEKLVPNNEAVHLYSIDADLVWYLLRLLERSDRSFQIYLRCRPGLSWCMSANPYPDISRAADPQMWLHINAFLADIRERYEPLRRLDRWHRFGTIFVLAALAGNDFVDSLHLVPVHHFFKAYFNNMEYIGSLVEGDRKSLRTDPGALARLTDCAVQQSHLRGGSDYIAEVTKKNAKTTRLPSPAGLAWRALHLDLCLLQMDSSGEPEFNEPLLCHFGYARRDRARPVGRGNLIRLHWKSGEADPEPDEWTFQGHLPPLATRGVL
jgi:hypothetical protein